MNKNQAQDWKSVIQSKVTKLYSTVTVEELHDICQYLNLTQFEMAVEERGSLHICGYPICSKSLPQSGRFKIDSSFGLFDSRKFPNHCSHTCFIATEFLKTQLSTDPIYLRNFNLQFDIIPCEVNPKKYLKQLSKKPTVFEQENKTELMTNYIDSLIQSFSSTTLSTIKIHEKLESTSMDVKKDQQVSTDQATIERLMNEYVTPSTTVLKSFQPSLETNPNQNVQHDMVEGYQVKYYGKKISTPKSIDSKQKVKKIRKPILTLFGETWTLLNAIVSTDTKEFVKHIHLDSNHTSHPLHQTNTIELQRNLIFCTRIQSQLYSIVKILKCDLLYDDLLLNLCNTFRFSKKFNISTQQDWILAAIFLKWLVDDSSSLDWSSATKLVNLGLDEFNILANIIYS